jgi:hypothetical protein
MSVKTKLLPFRQKPAIAPLHSWDIFMEGYWKKMALIDDKNELEQLSFEHSWKQEWNLHIVFASSNIREMNGYTATEVKGHSPKMFQGKDTDAAARHSIRQAVENRLPFQVTLLNYKKSTQPYFCAIEGFPVFNKHKKLSHFIAFETIATQ